MSDETDSDGWSLPPQQRALWFIDFAADQIRDLLPYVTGERRIDPPAVEVACKESFLLNVRLVADFLTRGKRGLDVLRREYAPDWELEDDLKERLNDWHKLISRHAMHLSRERVPDDVLDVEPIGPEHYRRMAVDCEEALAAFQASREAARHTP